MYKYIKDIEKIIYELCSTYEIENSSLPFYTGRIKEFFDVYMTKENNKDRPLNAITYFDINSYLYQMNCADTERLNKYNALKRFFEYTYLKNITSEVISNVNKPIVEKKKKEVLPDESYIKLRHFISDRKNDLYNRLVLALICLQD